MNLYPTHITLNGKLCKVEELLQKQTKKSGWEKDWPDFLAEWYNNSDFIEVKTSGSTGTPKTIRLKKDFVAASAQRTIQYFKLNEGDKVLHCLPSQFIAGKLMVARALIGKLDLYVIDPSTDFEILKTEQFKFAAIVPNQIQKMLKPLSTTNNPELILIGGSAIPATLELSLQTIQSSCFSSYAMTETATHIALRKLNGDGNDGYYHCLEGIRVERSEKDCLRIFMPGLEEAFLQTNDLADLKDEYTFRILGRADNIIISGGLKFSPEQIEKKLEAHITSDFFISSLPHDTLGHQLILVIEGEETPETKAHIQNICREHLDKYEQPRQIQYLPKLPRTINGKLNRNA